MIPLSVFGTMAYDIIKNKNQFYFTPVYRNDKFGRNMYVFSLKHILESKLQSIVFKLESTEVGGKIVGWLRKKIN